ncbi:MAG TPA: CIA30 family protein [Polyangiaceae bacterium]|nr:CIA30 family protein [Polyangiaceae bacterium]
MMSRRSLPFLASLVPVFLLCLGCDSGSSSDGNLDPGPGPVEVPALDLVIDDFEDGDVANALGGSWYSYSDVDNGGGSVVEFPRNDAGEVIMAGEGFESEHSLKVEFSFEQGELTYEPYIGFGASVGSATAPLDLSAYAMLQYTYRGAKHSVRLETADVTDYDYHGVLVPASSTWKTMELAFPLFTQENWGEPVVFDPTRVVGVSYHIRGTTGETGSLEVDNLGVVEQSGEPEPDMEIQEPAPPTLVTLESISIDNPLQALALESLDRGYNVTNWLEQERFESFVYDEAFVARVAEAGFRGLRLPIDLDLYVEASSGSGADLELTLHEDLFTILDSFNTWTEANGLSFTIDFHQYDRSLDFSDPASTAEAVALWGAVAEHFADNERKDLFFELLNEPELSAGGTAPTQAQWTELAEAMIAEIREHDDHHTIIFGDVEWYGIGPLSSREPLSDDNVIYAFHFYEPFVFTHQGASWANMATTHDLPFPYDPARWSDTSSDLGFTPFMESWILNEMRNYYRTGNANALHNRIVTAKKWAVDHNVPVICNEFGAYDGTSQLEDRVRYYTELTRIFRELEIPWQHWFMILDDETGVAPEYREAFGLDL